MNQAWLVPLFITICVLTVDLLMAYLRRRARRVPGSPEALTENELEALRDEGVTHDDP